MRAYLVREIDVTFALNDGKYDTLCFFLMMLLLTMIRRGRLDLLRYLLPITVYVNYDVNMACREMDFLS